MKNPSWKSAAALTLIGTFFLTTLGATNAMAQNATQGATESGFGVGIAIGQPSGISLSLPTGPDNAFNFLAGYEVTRGANLTLLGDYVWHRRDLLQVEVGKVSLYYGPGVRLKLAENPEASVRVVLGADYLFEGAPVQTFFELCPGINVVPDTRPNATVDLGVRYYF